MSESVKTVVVVGAGIVGVSAAIWLQRNGCKVIVVDREGPASGTSYGNAGVLAAASIVPVPVPGLWKKAPSMLLDKNQPLFMCWNYFPKLLPFLIKFMGNAKPGKVNRISSALSELLHDTASQHVSLAKGTPAEKFITTGDYVFGYKDKQAFVNDSFGWRLRRKFNHPFEEMTAEQFGEYDPAMAGRFGYAVRCPEHGHITDPGAYVKALAAHVEAQGGEFRIGEVRDVETIDGKASALITNTGRIEGDDFVIATGVWSGPLAKKLGIDVPLESERGYHIEFINPSIVPKSPMMVAAGKFVMTPMEGRLRCAGIVEFGGLDNPPSSAPVELLKRQSRQLLPELEYDDIVEWMGHRPSTADSLPLIGNTSLASNVWMGFGHQHIGLSAGPKTGHWLASLICGNKPNVDLSPFEPERFG